jgi:glyoxylase-like metal-dependent hydrolase (beta-lactamase superfamily II)
VTQLSEHVTCLALPVDTLPPYDHTNAYLVADGGVALLVDPGSRTDVAVETVTEVMLATGSRTLKAVVLTHSHPDHIDGVPRVLDAFGAPLVYVHTLESQRLPESWQKTVLQDGRRLTVGDVVVEALHTPGHSPGHLTLVVRDATGAIECVLVGDLVVASGSVWVGLPEGDMAEYLASLTTIGSLGAPVLGPGHGAAITLPEARLQELIEHRLDRERQIVAALGAGRLSIADITAEVYPGLATPIADLAARSVAAHLAKLVSEDKAVRLGPDEEDPYSLVV